MSLLTFIKVIVLVLVLQTQVFVLVLVLVPKSLLTTLAISKRHLVGKGIMATGFNDLPEELVKVMM